MYNLINNLRKTFAFIALLFCTAGSISAAPTDNIENDIPEPIFTIDFRKPEYKTSIPCLIAYDEGTEFDPTCGRSWKLDRYNAETNEFSFLEIEVNLSKDDDHSYVLELQQCARKDASQLSNVTITVNDQIIVQGFHAYNGPDNPHYPNENGKPWHLRWDVFECTNELKEGTNKIRISLDNNTQSGISMSYLHVRPGPK